MAIIIGGFIMNSGDNNCNALIQQEKKNTA